MKGAGSVCGYNVYAAAGSLNERREAMRRHRNSGEHGTMTKVNALRDGMAQVDAAVEREMVNHDE